VPSWSTLKPDDVMVSNFNARSNLQGTDTTIIKLVPNGTPVTFFGGSHLGLTIALAVLRSGFALVRNVPTTDGKNVVPPIICIAQMHGVARRGPQGFESLNRDRFLHVRAIPTKDLVGPGAVELVRKRVVLKEVIRMKEAHIKDPYVVDYRVRLRIEILPRDRRSGLDCGVRGRKQDILYHHERVARVLRGRRDHTSRRCHPPRSIEER
jgi:hypothetical protein